MPHSQQTDDLDRRWVIARRRDSKVLMFIGYVWQLKHSGRAAASHGDSLPDGIDGGMDDAGQPVRLLRLRVTNRYVLYQER